MSDTQPADGICLLGLPQHCILLVLQHLADDPRSLFSAARACSSLHKAAAQTFSNVTIQLRPIDLDKKRLLTGLLTVDSSSYERNNGFFHLRENIAFDLSTSTQSGRKAEVRDRPLQ